MRPLNQAKKSEVRTAKKWLRSTKGQQLIRDALSMSLEKNEKDAKSLRIDVKDLHVPVTI